MIRAAGQSLIAASSFRARRAILLQSLDVCCNGQNVRFLNTILEGLTVGLVLGFEVRKVLLIFRIALGLLVLGQLGIVMVFHSLASAFVRRLVIRREDLPSLADGFGNLGEAELFAL